MNREDRDARIAKHVDAIRTLIRPHWVLAVFAVREDGVPYFMAPDGHQLMIAAALEGFHGLTQQPPEST